MIRITFKSYIENGSKNFGETFEFHKGKVVGLFGKNGAGKTTLLKMLMGIRPYSNQLFMHTVDEMQLSGKTLNNMVYITDGHLLYDEMNAIEHKNFFSCFYKNFNADRFEKLMEMFELDKKLPVKKYSRGQRSKLELTLGFCKGAKYMLLDEPFLGTDPFSRADFLKIMAGMLDEDSIVIISTHYLEEIENFIDRALFMHNWKIIKDMSMDDIHEKGDKLMDVARDIYEIDKNQVLKLFLEEEK